MSKTFGYRLSQARKEAGLTQRSLAEKAGVAQAVVSRWENDVLLPAEDKHAAIEELLGPLPIKLPRGRGATDKYATTNPVSEVSDFGLWLREERERATLSVPKLAEAAGMSAVAIYNIENGRIQNPQSATRDKLAAALKVGVPSDVVKQTEDEQKIVGLGSLQDFDPHDEKLWPTCPGVYVLYDVSQRPIYVGKSNKISSRLKSHYEKFWFKMPIVNYASYIEVKDVGLRDQLEQVLIKFLKRNAVINQSSTEDFVN